MKYFIYCRKSSEEEERQALSIESQLQELRDYARKNDLLVVDVFTESKSARKPNNRPVFKEMLSNPFYTGVFRLKGELHPGSHPAMISQEIFDKVQRRLAEESRKVDWREEKRKGKGFLFKDVRKCGECGYTIVQDYHRKKSGLEFRYYKCTRKCKTCSCKQPAISEKKIAPQIESLVADIAIDDYWYQWCLDEINSWHEQEQGDIDSRVNELKQELEVCRRKLDRLLDIRIEGGISSDEYRVKKNKLVCSSNDSEHQISEIQDKGNNWLELLERSLKTCNQGHHSVIKKDFIQMGQILRKVGSNPILKHREYSISLSRPFYFFSKGVFGLRNCTSPQTTTTKKSRNPKQREELRIM